MVFSEFFSFLFFLSIYFTSSDIKIYFKIHLIFASYYLFFRGDLLDGFVKKLFVPILFFEYPQLFLKKKKKFQNIRRTNENKEFQAFCNSAIAERFIFEEWKAKNPSYFEKKNWYDKTFRDIVKEGLFTRTIYQHYKAAELTNSLIKLY